MHDLETKLSLTTILSSTNLAEELSDRDLGRIGLWCGDGLAADLRSRVGWEERMQTAMKLALQVMEIKTTPWQDASNVKFPLLTVAALQYHARVYPAIINSPDLVKCRTYGNDPDGGIAAAADLISEHMSWQILEQDEGWEEDTDRAFIVQAILGSVFKKSYFDKGLGHNVSEMVLPSDLVVDYWTKSLDTAQRTTHLMYMFENDIVEKQRLGLYLDIDCCEPNVPQPLGPLARVRDQAQGTQPQSEVESPAVVCEQRCRMDLDGDGYKEPYVVTFRHDSNKILRIRAEFFGDTKDRKGRTSDILWSGGKIARIEALNPYTKFPFIPSPDGGFYDLGFGVLLGPLNRSIDTAVNQLIDAGTMSNAGGGFLGRGVRLKGGEYTFRPMEWKRVESSGDDLQKGIFPLPVREPSAVLFQLLSLLIQYGEKVAGATESTTGENPGQNTKSGTFDSMVEQGLQIFNGIYKRNYRSFRSEYRKLYRLNQLYLNDSEEFDSLKDGERKKVLIEAYAQPPTRIRPAADPYYMSTHQRLMQATAVRQASADKPNLYNQLAVERWYLTAMKVPGIDTILVKEIPQPGPSEKIQIEQMRGQVEGLKLQAKQAETQLDFRLALLKLANEAELNQAQILEMQAHAVLLIEQAGTAKMDEEIALINAQIGAAKVHHEGLLKAVDVLSKVMQNDKAKETNAGSRTAGRIADHSGNEVINAGVRGAVH